MGQATNTSYLPRLTFSIGMALILLLATPFGAASQVGPDADSLLALGFRNYDEPIDPSLYLIRPGETLLVTFVGTKLGSISLKVGPEGNIVDRNLGSIDLAGKTLVEARAVLAKPIRSQYSCDDLQITVGEPYRVAISVTGAVAKPGIYVGYTSHRVSEIINLAGGITEGGSSRKIIFSGGAGKLQVDLEQALQAGNHANNYSLYAGRSIFVPLRSRQLVHLLGATPRSIELLETDDLGSIKSLAGGGEVNSDFQLFVLRQGWQPAEGIEIEAGEVFRLQPLLTDETLALFGEINRPGNYPFEENMVLADLISLGGGLTNEAQSDRIVLFRRAPEDEWGGLTDIRIPMKLSTSQSGLQTKLFPSDSIVVSGSTGFVEVVGLVRSPGFYPYRAGATARDYIRLAGGYSKLAEKELLTIRDRLTGLAAQVGADARPLDGDLIRIERKVSDR